MPGSIPGEGIRGPAVTPDDNTNDDSSNTDDDSNGITMQLHHGITCERDRRGRDRREKECEASEIVRDSSGLYGILRHRARQYAICRANNTWLEFTWPTGVRGLTGLHGMP